jgi:hypothetical protein
MDAEAALQLLIDKLKATTNNAQFLQMIAKSNLTRPTSVPRSRHRSVRCGR